MGMRRGGGGGTNPLKAVFSVKGAVVFGGLGYMWVAQREVLLKLVGMGLR